MILIIGYQLWRCSVHVLRVGEKLSYLVNFMIPTDDAQ